MSLASRCIYFLDTILTRQSTIDLAVRYQPELLEAKSEESVRHEAYEKYAKKMLGAVADQVIEYADKFDDYGAWDGSKKIRESNHEDLKSAVLIADSVRRARRDAEFLIQDEVTEEDLGRFIKVNSALALGLFPLQCSKRDATRRLTDRGVRLASVLEVDLFNQESIGDADKRLMEAQQTRQAVEERVKEYLAAAPRLKMSTIGSSHKLFDGPEDEKKMTLWLLWESLLLPKIENKKERSLLLMNQDAVLRFNCED